ncbi:hypothetical protein EON63_10095 [archaeon]|nr:MAG: hypothetical protein EON63_10095 [archaeon]
MEHECTSYTDFTLYSNNTHTYIHTIPITMPCIHPFRHHRGQGHVRLSAELSRRRQHLSQPNLLGAAKGCRGEDCQFRGGAGRGKE